MTRSTIELFGLITDRICAADEAAARRRISPGAFVARDAAGETETTAQRFARHRCTQRWSETIGSFNCTG
eukprot:6194325-Pleurochrysis_carterae.AAC.2